MEIISFILALAISIGLGICLSYYMTMKMLCSSRGRSMMRDVMTSYGKMAMEVTMEAMEKATGEKED